MQILPIGSGKGGVGKSVLATNLSIALAQAGKRVVLVDLDLGGSNLHTLLGLRSVKEGVGTFLNTPRMKFERIILPTEYEGLFFVPGDAEIPRIADLTAYQRKKLLRNLAAVETDFLVLDLGAGTSRAVMDFFVLAGKGIVVTTPTLIAILNAYLFVKNAVFRLLYASFPRGSPAYTYLEQLRKAGNQLQRIYVPKLFGILEAQDPENYATFIATVSKLQPRLVLNMLDDPNEIERIDKLRRSTQEYLAVSMEHLGVVYRDGFQEAALNSRIPIIRYKPDSLLPQAIYRIAEKIAMSPENEQPLDLETLDESYQVAEIEAESDYQAKSHELEELLHCGALTTGDLVETVRMQQFEIQQLKKENQLLKEKLVRALEAGYRA